MGTGFKVAIKCGMGQKGLILNRPYGIYLRMRTTKFVMVALTNDAVIIYNYTANQGICPGKSQAFSGQFETAAHVYFILLSHLTLPLLLFLIMLQNHATLSEIRAYLQKELSVIYSGGEISALTNIIMEHLGYPSPEPFLNPQHQAGVATIAQINEIVTRYSYTSSHTIYSRGNKLP